jgi:uncharacterized protein YbbC (DUF1343 family)
VRFVITDRDAFQPVRFGLEIGSAISKLFPKQMNWAANQRLVGDLRVLEQMEAGTAPAAIEQSFATGLEQFRRRRESFLLY